MQPILFPVTGIQFNSKSGGIAPNFCGGRILPPVKLIISGVTKDSLGNVLGSCTVSLFRTIDDILFEEQTSDASTGAYSFSSIGLSENYYVVAYKAGSPDVAGTTRNDLVGVT